MAFDRYKSIRSLEPSFTRESHDGPHARSIASIEDFLDQLDHEVQTRILAQLLNGESLIEKFGEETGRELAAYRLASLMPAIGEAANRLSDVDLVVTRLEDRTDTSVELTRAARI